MMIGWRKCPSSWCSTISTPSRIRPGVTPCVPIVTNTAKPPPTRTPTSGTKLVMNTNSVSGATSGTPRADNVMPMTSPWNVAMSTLPRM